MSPKLFKKIFAATIGILIGLGAVHSQTVDRAELQTITIDAVQFQNYTGPVVRFETDTQIRSIGSEMAKGLPLGEGQSLVPGSSTFGEKYKVTRIPAGTGPNLRGADVLEILEGGAVDHIDNVRRIIAGYLEGAFGYARNDAQTLSIFITIYNGIHRQSGELFALRYIPEVLSFLDPVKIGLSLNYRDWAGQSQIVIPLTAGTRAGELLSVAADEIAGDEVRESLRDTPSEGIEERQELVDLLDRAAEEQRDIVVAEQQAIQEERAQTRETIADLETEREEISTQVREAEDRRDAEAVQELKEELATVEDNLEAAQEKEAELETRQEVVEQRIEAAEQAQEASDEIRQEVAQDLLQNQVLTQTPAPPRPFIYPSTRLENGRVVTSYQILNQNDGQAMSPLASPLMAGRNLLELSQGFLGIEVGAGGDEGNLIFFDTDDLQEILRAEVPVYSLADLVYDPNNSLLYTVIRRDGDWYLGQFDLSLNPIQSSAVPVQPMTGIYLGNDTIFVTRKDGRITRLSRSNLRSE